MGSGPNSQRSDRRNGPPQRFPSRPPRPKAGPCGRPFTYGRQISSNGRLSILPRQNPAPAVAPLTLNHFSFLPVFLGWRRRRAIKPPRSGRRRHGRAIPALGPVSFLFPLPFFRNDGEEPRHCLRLEARGVAAPPRGPSPARALARGGARRRRTALGRWSEPQHART